LECDEDIKKPVAGKIVRSPTGYTAYVPNQLPPVIEWDGPLASALSRADFLLGQLAREGSKLPNPHLLMRPFITREAVLSSKIEGTQATIGEVLAHDAGIETSQNPHDLQEVQNYIEPWGLEWNG
jgi:Fic family protein